MNDRPLVLTDSLIERGLSQRAPHHADASLLASIIAEAGRTPQRRARWRVPALLPSSIRQVTSVKLDRRIAEAQAGRRFKRKIGSSIKL